MRDIITVGAQGYGTQSRGPVPGGRLPRPTRPSRSTRQDLDKAKALLAEAGYEDGGFPMEPTYAAENQNEARFAPLIKDAFAKLGIDVTLTPIAFNQQWERAKGDAAGRQDMFLLLYWPTYSRRRLGQPVVPVPQQRDAVLQPLVLERRRPTTSSSTTPAA